MENRRYGKTHAMILSIKATLEGGYKVGIAGCKDPQPTIDRLKKMGLDAKSKPMTVYSYDGHEEYIIGFTGGEKTQTGFIFYC